MKSGSIAVLAFLIVLAAAGTAPAQNPPARQPPAFLTAGLGIESSTMAVGEVRAGLEVPVGPLRPWLGYGAWIIGGYSCIPEHPGPCNPSGTLLEAGVDAAPGGARTALLPFVGVGLSLHDEDRVGRATVPLARVGADLQPWPWLAPRIMIEATRYPRAGATLLFTGAMRVGLPLR